MLWTRHIRQVQSEVRTRTRPARFISASPSVRTATVSERALLCIGLRVRGLSCVTVSERALSQRGLSGPRVRGGDQAPRGGEPEPAAVRTGDE